MINEYIELCKIFGSSIDYIQANGGNISIKSDTNLLIKKSGFNMEETTVTDGYVVCDKDAVLKKYNNSNEDIQDCVIEGKGHPSIETFFHLIPKKYIVHLHPYKLIALLCMPDWKEKLTNITNHATAFIPYFKPGLELSKYILTSYKGEQVLFLQNHGVIICTDDYKEVYIILKQIMNNCDKLFSNIPSSDIEFILEIYNILGKNEKDLFIKPCLIPNKTNDRYFYKLTPDIILYLGDYPIIFEHNYQTLESEIAKYYEKIGDYPKVIIKDNITYCIGTTSKGAKALQDVLISYYNIMYITNNQILNEISTNGCISIKSWDKEKYRLNQ
jgi:rhamnose utilization protein RhaD (predicted bifunctional aldolase and dehydrogenase)